jgi:Uma2 family endonuclease
MAQPEAKHITQEQFLTLEREATEKHEYYKGEIFAMSGASFPHNKIENNVRLLLGNHLKGGRCEAFGSNLRVHIPENSLYTYPDIFIICDDPIFIDNEFDTVTNPSVIIEILSPLTGDYDKGAKFDLYRQIKSLEEYILIDSTKVHFIHYSKNEDATWTLSDSKSLDEPFFISSVQFKVSLSEVYAGIEKI